MSHIKQPPFPPRPAGPDEVVLDIHDIQALAFEIMLAFDAFCKRHGLKYYLCGGTLLGAVRHQGFIPWDDDIDMFMSRPEYERLVEIAQTESIGPHYTFACPENGRFYRPFARVYDTRTEVQRKYWKPMSGPHTWIDILPVDGLPDDREEIARIYKKRKFLNKMNFSAMCKLGTGNRDLKVIQRYIEYPMYQLLGVKGWCRQLDKLRRKNPYEARDTVGCVTGGRYGVGEAMPKAEYEKSVTVTFEGHIFETMSCYREYLSGIYGDYMKLPAEKDRHPHLDYVTMLRKDHQALMERHPGLKAK